MTNVFLERKPSSDSNIDKILSRMRRTAEEGNNDVEDLMTKVRARRRIVSMEKGSKVEPMTKRATTCHPNQREI